MRDLYAQKHYDWRELRAWDLFHAHCVLAHDDDGVCAETGNAHSCAWLGFCFCHDCAEYLSPQANSTIARASAALATEKSSTEKSPTDVKRKRPAKIFIASGRGSRGGLVYKISAACRIGLERTAKNIAKKKMKQAAKEEAEADAILAEFIGVFGDD